MKHDSNISFNSRDHTEQHHPSCPPRACAQHSAVSHRQVPAQALLPVLQLLFWVLCWDQPWFLSAVFLHCSCNYWCTVCYRYTEQKQLGPCTEFGKNMRWGTLLLTNEIVLFPIKTMRIGAHWCLYFLWALKVIQGIINWCALSQYLANWLNWKRKYCYQAAGKSW